VHFFLPEQINEWDGKVKVKFFLAFVLAVFVASNSAISAQSEQSVVGKYRLFEAALTNNNSYENKFSGVELKVVYTSPTGRRIPFWGFYDGDGAGGGDMVSGNVWKMRFLPDEVGKWSYTYSWSDGTPGGKGAFSVSEKGAGKGILKAYKDNPHWFAYNGTEPVWLKSYYETGHGSIAQDFDWVTDNVFQPLVDNGYNHLQVNWLMSLCCFEQYYKDGPEPTTTDLALYEEGKASSTMNLLAWQLMEKRMDWLNDRNVGVHMFLGFDGSRNDGPAWEKLSEAEKIFYVKYAVARLAPYANLAGWNFVWEVEGGRETHELGLAKLLAEYDIFGHLRTYEDECPRENHYTHEAYTFAAVENHQIVAPTKDMERYNYWRTAWTHYMGALLGYEGKPVYMSEGNSLWRRYWHNRIAASQDDLRQAAWATVMAGASFNWNGHASENELRAGGPEGLPFSEENEFHKSAKYIDILSKVMSEDLAFYKMTPQPDQLSAHDPFRVFALAETGKQYAVFSMKGEPFSLFLGEEIYADNKWVNTKTGEEVSLPQIKGFGALPAGISFNERDTWPQAVSFTPPSADTDWVLILKAGTASH